MLELLVMASLKTEQKLTEEDLYQIIPHVLPPPPTPQL